MRFALLVTVMAGALGAAEAGLVLAPGTQLNIRLETAISSNTSKPGQPFEAVLIAPVMVGNAVAVPAGARVRGTVASVKPALKREDEAQMALRFEAITTPTGKVLKLDAKLIDVDNARESVDESGKIIGIRASQTLASQVEQGIGKLGERNPELAGVLDAARSVVLDGAPQGEISYAPGTEMSLRLQSPLAWPEPIAEARAGQLDGSSSLSGLVNALPLRTTAEKPRTPSDLTNLLFIGSEKALRDVFKAAGWSLADQLNAESVLETVRAVAELRGYKEAPMSRLLLQGKQSDFDYQKGLNTFEKRHHLRIWRRSETFEGKPVWIAAATHDIGIEVARDSATFIHVIDSQIDKERTKVADDLRFTGRVKDEALIERPKAPRETTNATGDAILTDGRIHVLLLE